MKTDAVALHGVIRVDPLEEVSCTRDPKMKTAEQTKGWGIIPGRKHLKGLLEGVKAKTCPTGQRQKLGRSLELTVLTSALCQFQVQPEVTGQLRRVN